MIKSDEDFAACQQNELATHPLSLLVDISMRKTEKAAMYHVVQSYASCEQTYTKDSVHVEEDIFCVRWYGHNMEDTVTCTIHTYLMYICP